MQDPKTEPVKQEQASIDPAALKSMLDEIDTYAAKVKSDWNVPGMAVAIVKDDKVIFSKGYGVCEINTERNVDGDTLFAIASNSKAFTAASLAILVDEGKLKWDDPVTKYLPDFQMPDAWVTREMTVRDLVCHRSGMDTFSGDLLWYDTTYSADDVISRIRHLKPVSSFRSRYGYQNLMFISAGKILEKVSGKTWGAFVRTRVLDPLGMKRTTTSVIEMKDNFALPHNESLGNGLRVLPPGNVDNSWGACGLNSSVNDIARWMRMQLGHGSFDGKQIVSREQIWDMWQPYTVMPISEGAFQANPARNFQAYGLGFALYDWHGRKIVSHGGGLDGMISQLAIVPGENLGVIVLTNSESSASRYVRDRVLECFLGVTNRPDRSAEGIAAQAKSDQSDAEAREKQNAARVPDAKPTLALDGYAGRYTGDLYGDVNITLEGDHLVLRLGPAPNFVADLEPWHYNTFQIKWRDTVKYNFPRGFVNFTIDATGKPDQLIIDQPNNDFWFYELDLHRVKE